MRAQQLAAGWAAGTHRAERKGSGVEFAGHRAYTPGDDLRRLDRHALLRHGRLLIREFLSDTERSVHLIVDATSSMNYRGQQGSQTSSKLELALLLAAALGFIAMQAGDRIGLSAVTDAEVITFLPRGTRESFERILSLLETLDEAASAKTPATDKQSPPNVDWNRLFSSLGASLPRGTVIFVLSDFLDSNDEALRSLAALATRRRALRVAQILTREEVDFPFEGTLRLRDLETGDEVETEAASVRGRYQRALFDLKSDLGRQILGQGGQFLELFASDPPDVSLRALASGRPIDEEPLR